MANADRKKFDELTVAEKILYVQHLWDEIARHPDDVDVTQAQRDELDRRLDRMEDSPDDTVSWSDVRDSFGEGQ